VTRVPACVALAILAAGCGLVIDFDSDDAGASLDGSASDAGGTADAGGRVDAAASDAGREDSDASEAGGADAGPPLPASCREIYDAADPDSLPPNGAYEIEVDGERVTVYCDIANGGWTKVETVNPVTGCPGDWQLFPERTVCWAEPREGCSNLDEDRVATALFHVPLASYERVRGNARGLQFGTTDGFWASGAARTIDQPYVDGVSITVGSPRQHVWTFVAGLFDVAMTPDTKTCPCTGSGTPPPSFVGSSYDCDSANTDYSLGCVWHDGDLWDSARACGGRPDASWFDVEVGTRSDPIEVRILLDQVDENVGVSLLELYVM